MTTNDAWKIYAGASGKGKDNDYFFHHVALHNLIEYYVAERLALGLPALTRFILWTDGAPGQYMCCQNFVKVASWWFDHGIELVHRLVPTRVQLRKFF